MSEVRPCLLIPIYEHGQTIGAVVQSLADFDLPLLIVDDGSGESTQRALSEIVQEHAFVEVVRRPRNGGRGAALRDGYRLAAERGFTHALQLDADAQHDAKDVPRLLAAARARPDALVLGRPIFDDSAPAMRMFGRKFSQALVWLETLSFVIRDPLCGFRCIPLAATLRVLERTPLGDKMDFDPELIVRLVWEGLPVVSVPTPVRYDPEGLSHFEPVADTLRIAKAHARLVAGMLRRAPRLLVRRPVALPPPQLDAENAEAPGWLASREVGSMAALRFALFVMRNGGRLLAVPLLWPITIYFFLTARDARRASLDYLERVAAHPEGLAALGGQPDWRHVLRHIHAFAEGILDRICFFAGNTRGFHFEFQGREHLVKHVESGSGALLMGAHLGSFDVLRVLADEHDIHVKVLMFTGNAQRINAAFEQLDPRVKLSVIELDPSSVRSAFAVRASLADGDLVAVLADRVGFGARERVARVPFLGKLAPLPEGPFLLSMVLGAPTAMLIALKTGRRRYHVIAEPMDLAGPVPRRERARVLEEQMTTFASRLERLCLQYPYQWFNFYDYWGATAAEREESA